MYMAFAISKNEMVSEKARQKMNLNFRQFSFVIGSTITPIFFLDSLIKQLIDNLPESGDKNKEGCHDYFYLLCELIK